MNEVILCVLDVIRVHTNNPSICELGIRALMIFIKCGGKISNLIS